MEVHLQLLETYVELLFKLQFGKDNANSDDPPNIRETEGDRNKCE